MRKNLTPEVCLNAAVGLALQVMCCGGLTLSAADRLVAVNLTVRVYNYAGVPAETLAAAEEESARILRAAGIELSWAPCAVSDLDFESSPAIFEGCVRATDAPIVRIEARPATPHGAVAGTALEERVAVSYERVEKVAAGQGIARATVLSHVMSHELGHLLLGENSHSSSGIMIGTYRARELHSAESGKLLFTAPQAARMRARLQEAGLRAGRVGGASK